MAGRNMVFDFTHSYPEHEEKGLCWYDCSEISGSRLYCDGDSEKMIKELIRPNGISGIHVIDSGDYHYITKLMTDFIDEPFTLVLIDHHTDMKEGSIGDLLSCGNWAKRVLTEKKYLQKLVLIGQEQSSLDSLSFLHSEKLIGISYDELKNKTARGKICCLPKQIPIYISIDKDVLDEKYAVTNWEQGEMSLCMLEDILKVLITDYEVIGIDICGDFPEENSIPEFLKAERINAESDEELYHFLENSFK